MNLARVCLIAVVISLNCITGFANQCIRFNDNYALFPSSLLLRPTNQITVECWIKPEKYFNWGAPFSYVTDNLHDESGYALAFNEGKMRFMLITEEMLGQAWTSNPGVEIEIDQWCHIAGVYNGKSIKLYLNGVLKGERYISGSIDWNYPPNQFSLGAFIDDNELHYFSGCIDEVRIWNRPLSVDEIQKQMLMELSGDEDGLILYLPFSEEGAIIKDHSINQLDGRIVNYSIDNRVPSLAMIQPNILNSNIVSTSSFTIDWTVPSQVEFMDVFYIDLAYDSKFNSILPGFKGLKTKESSFTFKDVPGGKNLYARIKGRSAIGEFTAYSNAYKINEFSTSLTINLLSVGRKLNNQFIILDNNILTTEYFKFQKGTKSIIVESTLFSGSLQQETYAHMHIKGRGVDGNYEINRISNLVFSDLKPGKYEISLSWGSHGSNLLKNNFVIEIDKFWWQNIWFYVIVLLTISGIVVVGIRNLVLVSRKRYDELIDGFMPAPEKDINITQEEITEYYNQLVDLMNREKLYLEPRLNLKNIADRLDLTTNIVSKVIHEKYGYHFNDFVNKFRIEEVKKHLKSKDSANLKIVAIAYKCGFNSESTFFRVFKKYTGETPSGYQKKLRKNK